MALSLRASWLSVTQITLAFVSGTCRGATSR